MAGTAVRGRLSWQLGNVVELVEETPRVKSIVLELAEWPGHRAGQHVDVRLTAEGPGRVLVISASGVRTLMRDVPSIQDTVLAALTARLSDD